MAFDAADTGACRQLAGSTCALGVFDGVHRGHRFLIGEALRDAAEHGSRCVVLTFDRDPDELFAPGLRKLMPNGERIAALERTGADAVGVIRFDRALAALSPEAFLEGLFGSCPPRAIHVGSDFRFGRGAAGTVADLAAWGAGRGMACCAHSLLQLDGAPVTATRIRGLIDAGDAAGAEELLGHPLRQNL